ncbi:ribose 5-phosphate isomerase B [Acetobacterium wieringae]|uniref:Ribose 5-phosphate isomerase B n=1 Tax=Acetobacterium wieringae TaxID=52694 RepID=A0A5D0WTQ1_9FIRM|nr:ribose 5-phosphate isomerase B [Acetobacterium wieringae]MEA4806008.1 ribose 5-phosphate isomerase B [Acetobacterium wieringae]TYC87559.1 ribose 5-phosphate isomerase B [Acetobacterium wieringae]
MKLAIGSDHGGLALKAVIKPFLIERGHEVVDFGTETADSCDYPIYGQRVGEAVSFGDCDRGIAICGTGLGISMAVNKVPGIRGALCTNEFMAEMSREHNDANVLVLGARVLGEGLALRIVKVWLETEFGGDRHQRRIDGITAIEKKYSK